MSARSKPVKSGSTFMDEILDTSVSAFASIAGGFARLSCDCAQIMRPRQAITPFNTAAPISKTSARWIGSAKHSAERIAVGCKIARRHSGLLRSDYY